MATVSAHRQGIPSIARQVTSRLVHTSSRRRAAALSATGQLTTQVEESTLQPIFDIFDAPTRLAETGEFIRSKYRSPSPAKVTSLSSYTTTMFPASYSAESKHHPTTLPAPVVFDGPARPKNASLALKARMRQASLTPSRNRARPCSTIDASMARSFSSEPQIVMFDGPARITRYHHNPSGSDRGVSSAAKLAFGLGVVGTIGYATSIGEGIEGLR